MMSFQIIISPSRRAAASFVVAVRRALQKAYIEKQKESGLTQTAIARALGVHRSVINRELRGRKDITLGRVAELAWAMGLKPHFALLPMTASVGVSITSYNVNQAFISTPTGAATAFLLRLEPADDCCNV